MRSHVGLCPLARIAPAGSVSAMPTLPQRLRHAGLLAGLLAFVMQVMVWTATMPAVAVADTGAGATADTVTICTPGGFKSIKIGPDGRASPDDAGANTGENGDADGKDLCKGHCPLCSIVGGAGLPPTAPLAVPAHRLALADERALPGDVIAAGWFLSTLQARAPPRAG